MKNKNILNRIVGLAVLGTFLLGGCAKSEKEPEGETEPAPPDTEAFTWTSGSGSSVKADSSFFFPGFSQITSYKSGGAQIIDIFLPSLNVGTYTISPATGIKLLYTTGSNEYSASSGTVAITANTGSKLSGSFGVTFTGASIPSLSGSFTDVPKK